MQASWCNRRLHSAYDVELPGKVLGCNRHPVEGGRAGSIKNHHCKNVVWICLTVRANSSCNTKQEQCQHTVLEKRVRFGPTLWGFRQCLLSFNCERRAACGREPRCKPRSRRSPRTGVNVRHLESMTRGARLGKRKAIPIGCPESEA